MNKPPGQAPEQAPNQKTTNWKPAKDLLKKLLVFSCYGFISVGLLSMIDIKVTLVHTTAKNSWGHAQPVCLELKTDHDGIRLKHESGAYGVTVKHESGYYGLTVKHEANPYSCGVTQYHGR